MPIDLISAIRDNGDPYELVQMGLRKQANQHCPYQNVPLKCSKQSLKKGPDR